MTATPSPRVSAIKLALMARKAREQVGGTLAADPIAIVGMGCRVPGGVTSPESFWSFLLEARSAVTPVPGDRWDAARWHGEGPDAVGRSIAAGAAFLDHIDGFDAGYFGIAPREADQMDPQQRLFLEVATEAIEDAGLRFEGLRRSRTGVFAASYHNDYAQMLYRDPEAMDQRTLTGTLHSVLANRLSYLFDLRGPSISLDTACSSSLVAVHMACQSLRTGESDIALAGGVSAMIQPELMVAMSRLGFLAPDGSCKTFDASANGFGRGEGAGVIVLKRLSDALADHDRIWSVIRGSVVNQDGESTLLAAPNGQAQAALVRDAVAASQIAVDDLAYIETHGTGTALGDPIEVEALATTIGKAAEGRPDCVLGAVKANIGHLEAAAGVVGLIKAALVLTHGEIPAQPNFRRLNPHIDLSGSRLRIADRRQHLPRTGGTPAAGVSSFGVGGTNAHVVLEAAPAMTGEAAAKPAGAIWTLPLSARSPDALEAMAQAWLAALAAPSPALDDLCFTAATRRSHHRHRLAVTGATREEMHSRLARRTAQGNIAPPPHPNLCFVFCGQGPQVASMGLDLAAADPGFARHLESCDETIRAITGWSLLEELARPEAETRLGETAIAQPALVAIQTGLAALLARWGFAPSTVIGHSIGEIAALHSAGMLPLAEALRIACHRGRIMQEADGTGGMASVPIDAAAARTLIARFDPKLSVAAVNAPGETVLSGATEALDEALAELASQGIQHRRLPVRYAFHSDQMTGFDRRLVDALGKLETASPTKARIMSTVTGVEITEVDAAHVARGIRATVRFAEAVRAAAQVPGTVFVEIGPHPVLGASIAACLEAEGTSSEAILPTLRRGQLAQATLAETAGRLYEFGHDPDWAALLPAGGRVTSLPRYPWQHRRHWREVRDSGAQATGRDTLHPLLGTRLAIAAEDVAVFEGGPSQGTAWIGDHRIFGRTILPGTGAMELLAAAAREVAGPASSLGDFAMLAPLPVPEPGSPPLRWQVVARAEEGHWGLKLVLPDDTEGTAGKLIAEGRAVRSDTAPQEQSAEIGQLADGAETGDALSGERIDARFREAGAEFGPAFRLLGEVRAWQGMATGEVHLPTDLAAQAHLMHPAALDAGVQLALLAAGAERTGAWLPVAAQAVHLPDHTPSGTLTAWAVLRDLADPKTLIGDVTFRDQTGSIVARIDGLRFASADQGMLSTETAQAVQAYRTVWREVTQGRAPTSLDGSLLLIAPATLGAELANSFALRGLQTKWLNPEASDADLAEALDWLAAAEGPRRLLDLSALQGDLDAAGAVTAALARLKALLSRPADAVSLAVVTNAAFATAAEEGPAPISIPGAALQSFYATAATEHPEFAIRGIDLDPSGRIGDADWLAEALAGCLALPAPSRIALRGNTQLAPVLERLPANDAPGPRALDRGDGSGLDALRLTPIPSRDLSPGEVRVAIRAAGLNFRDVLGTMGLLPGTQPPLGVEMSGEVIETAGDADGLTPGDRVFGYAPGALAEEVVVPAHHLMRLPAGLSDADAAGLTVAFGTALYGLDRLAGLRAGQRTLIHAGMGGVGQAAIQIALARGAEVFATAGSEEKRAQLREMGVTLARDSRSLGFEAEIAAATGGEGVDVVLNSLSGAFIPASVRSLSLTGCFLELGKRDLMSDAAFRALRPGASYFVYDLGQSIEADPEILPDLMREILSGLDKGLYQALPTTCFGLERASEAMRWMAAARHAGKIVLRVAPRSVARMRPDATYWITGGLGGLGLYTARWMADQGARHLVLSGRTAPDDTAQTSIAELAAMGVEVRTFEADVSVDADIARVLQAIADGMPPLRGIVHAAGALRDGPVATRTAEDVAAVFGGKLGGALALDRQTRNLPLDFFILYSAAATLLGSPGQTLYAGANAGLDALAQARRREGLPALAIAWGRWEGAGMAARLAGTGNDGWSQRGLGGLTPTSGFAPLDTLLSHATPTAMIAALDWPRFLATAPAGLDPASFAEMASAAPERKSTPAAPRHDLRARLSQLAPDEARSALDAIIAEAAIDIIGLAPGSEIDPSRPLKEMGLDSLMAIELRNALVRQTGIALSATLLFDYPTIGGLTDHLAPRLGIAEPAATSGDDPYSTEDLSETDLEALLEAELAASTSRRSETQRDFS